MWACYKWRSVFLFLCALMASALGCSSIRFNYDAKKEGEPLSQTELKKFFEAAQDPRRFNVTTYESSDGPVFKGINRLHPGQQALLPMASGGRSTAPVVTLKGRESAHLLGLLDSTSAWSWADLPGAHQVGATPLFPGDTRYARHVPDTAPGYATLAAKLRFEQLHVESVLLYVRAVQGTLGPLLRGSTTPPSQLVLGTDLIRAFEFVQVDYPRRKVVLSTTRAYEPLEEALLATVGTEYIAGVTTAEGAVDGEPKRIVLDTAGDYAVAMPAPVSPTVRQLRIGDLVMVNVPVVACTDVPVSLEPHVCVGRKLLSRYKMTFANKGRIVHFEQPVTKNNN